MFVERDVKHRVRSATSGFRGGLTDSAGFSITGDRVESWKAYEYDIRDTLTKVHSYKDSIVGAPSVGVHTNATNTSVASVSNGLLGGTGAGNVAERIRDGHAGGLLEIFDITNNETSWFTTPLANGSTPGRKSGHQLGFVEVDGGTYETVHGCNGRIEKALDHSLRYDETGRLAYVEHVAEAVPPASPVVTPIERYWYDADGRMVAHEDIQGIGESVFAYDGIEMTAAFDKADKLKWEAVWGPGQDQLLAFHDHVAQTDYVPITDYRNSIVGTYDIYAERLDGIAEYTAEGRVRTTVGMRPRIA